MISKEAAQVLKALIELEDNDLIEAGSSDLTVISYDSDDYMYAYSCPTVTDKGRQRVKELINETK